ncbi:GNAT family N-acetyltransferase [Citrobacter braakii]|uniref:GNAT family N-acetyltransferase n=1 Tax=Citrobacter TaxID=544 RepID=UPI00129975A4|nr:MULTISPECIES: GNAT family N-acetyltransferase [Citrobacter]MDU2945047.1 GNAT family N-acetyltransferase [Citrobacter sp.]QGG14114.1 GNAT family N-acetyltransferase [Citrobacter braakii]WFW23774.1 GNAT family N-acetyltransferase [Citrobacter braakii]HAT7998802.1 GNAT family N-acetyltransferase [Citrobacter braakii]
MTEIKFVDFDEIYLNKSWEWLQDEEIRILTNTPPFTKSQQQIFYESLPRKDYLIWGVEVDKLPIGVLGLKNIKHGKGEYFGYIGNKDYWGKGLFKEMKLYILEKAKENEIDYIYLKVIKGNKRAIRAYHREGFILEKENEDSIEMVLRIL